MYLARRSRRRSAEFFKKTPCGRDPVKRLLEQAQGEKVLQTISEILKSLSVEVRD
jgi:hypothetical protein